MREYGGSFSSPTIVIASRGWTLRMVSAAITPAGPAPRMTWCMALQAQALARFGLDRAVRVPAADLVVLGQHLGQLVDLALGRTGLGGLGQQALGQVVVGRGEACAVVEVALHVPDALADLLQFLGRVLVAAGGRDLRRQVGQAPGEGGEDAQARR